MRLLRFARNDNLMLVEEKGAALIIAMLVMVMLTLIGLAAINTSTTEMQISANVKGSSQALYLAEAGLNQAIYWFNNPNIFTPTAADIKVGTASEGNAVVVGNTATYNNFFKKRRNNGNGNGTSFIKGSLSQFFDTDNNIAADTTDARTVTSTIPNIGSWAMKITDSAYLDGMFGYLDDVGKITEIYVYSPIAQGANGNYATVRVKAQTNAGATRTIEQEIGPSFFLPIQGGVESGAAGALNGNSIGHWGSMLIDGNMDRNTWTNLPTNLATDPDYDQWFKLKAKGDITIQGSSCSVSNCSSQGGNWTNHDLSAHQTVTIDKWDKSKVKSYAQGESSYYVYDCTSSHVFKNSVGSEGASNDFGTFKDFANGGSFGLVYVDKGSSCTASSTISLQGGGGFYTEGVFYMDIGLDMSGLGGGTTKTVKKPDDSDYTLGVHFNGIVYTTGVVTASGNSVVYGSMIAEGGYGGGGTVDVYYNSALASGPILNIPVVSKQTWREIR